MKNGKYWAERFKALEEMQNRSDAELLKEIDKMYSQAKKDIESSISRWYVKFAENNEISMAEAKKLLKSDELQEFKWTVEEYIEHGENNIDGTFEKQLINASSKVHINRYESLLTELRYATESLSGRHQSLLTEHLKKAYTENYYHTAYEIQKGTGVGVRLGGIDERTLEQILKKPWAADENNFSDRIWKDRTSLLSEINTQLTRNIATGKGPDEAIKAIAKRFETSKYNAGRLVMTESAAISAKARENCFHDLDVEEFEVVETLDSHTCGICGDMDGKHFSMQDYQVGVTVPPFHPRCRGTTCPYFADMEEYGERAARDSDGKTYYVPSDMKYKDWKQKYIVDATSAADKAMFERYKGVLRDLSPKTLEEFIDIKYNNSAKWEQLKYQFRTLNRYEINGDVSAKKIIELDNAAFYTKKNGFDFSNLTGKSRVKIKQLANKGNAAVMDFEGSVYFAHSSVAKAGTIEYDSYSGQYPLVGLKDNRLFSVMDLGDKIPRENDTEAKFLEYVATKKQTDDSFTVTILSEKHICESCKGVVKQFKEMFPNAEINIISGKTGYNGSEDGLKTWKHRKMVK